MADGGHTPTTTLPGGIPYVPHPLAELFPLMEGEALNALVADIREHGVREPIVLLDGKVLDGRNRYLAARECGATLPTAEFDGADPLAFVISLNLKRRHLNESQRAMVAAKIAKQPKGANQHTEISAPSQARAAEMLNVSVDSIQFARRVEEQGVPELAAAVASGAVAVSAAAEVSKLAEPLQAALVDQGPDAVRAAAGVVRTTPDPKIREQIISAAANGLRPAPTPSRRNPDYQPNPDRDAARRAVDACQEVARVLGQKTPRAFLAALHDDAERSRAILAMGHARDFLVSFLEDAHARAA